MQFYEDVEEPKFIQSPDGDFYLRIDVVGIAKIASVMEGVSRHLPGDEYQAEDLAREVVSVMEYGAEQQRKQTMH